MATNCGSPTTPASPTAAGCSSTLPSGPLPSGPRCGPQNADRFGYHPLHKKISIVEVPLARPERASLLKTVPVDVPTWNIYDIAPTLPPGFNPIQGCHDLQADLRTNLMAAACASVGQLWFHSRRTGATLSSFQIPRDQAGSRAPGRRTGTTGSSTPTASPAASTSSGCASGWRPAPTSSPS